MTNSAPISTTVNARDGGTADNPNDGSLGMWFTELDVPKQSGGTATLSKSIDFYGSCGGRISRCPRDSSPTFTYSTDDADGAGPGTDPMPEGINTIQGDAADILYKSTRYTSPTTVKVDRSVPVIDGLSGSLVEDEDDRIADSSVAVSVRVHDGDTQGSRAGVRRAEVLIDGSVKATKEADCGGGQCPRDAQLDLTVDTSQIEEGQRTIAVRVLDDAANASTSEEWVINLVRDDEMEEWLLRLRAYVDGLSPLPLLGEPPRPADDYKNPDYCLASEGALRSCYGAIVSWQKALDSWLTLNLVSGTGAEGLPAMPVYEDAPNGETVDLMRAAAGLFQLTADVHASASARTLTTVSLESPIAQMDAASLMSDVEASGDIELYGTYVAPDRVFTGGSSGRQDEDNTPLPAMISEQLENFYVDRVEITAGLVNDLTAESAEESPADPETTAALAAATQYRDAVQRRDPYVSGFTAELNAKALLNAATTPNTAIKALTIPTAADGSEATGPTATLRAAVEAFAMANAASDEEPLVSAAVTGSSFMPSNWRARTLLWGSPNRYGHQVKRTRMAFEWKRPGSLRYFRSAKNHKRGFEAQARPDKQGTPWSSDWFKNTWDSDLPHAYRDDLFEDGKYKNFAVGTGYGRSLRMNKRYHVFYETNAGAFETTDGGRVILEGQATRRAKTIGERGYLCSEAN